MRNPHRRREILHNIELSQNVITLLQETHITPDMYRQTAKLWTGTMLFSPGKQNTDGTIICIKDNSIKPTNTVNDPNGKFQITDIRIDKLNITLINVYAPSGNTTQNQYKRREFWEDLTKTVSAFIKQDKHYILAGDFNVPLQDIDRQSRASQNYKCHSQSSLLNLIHMLDVEDTFRTFHPNLKGAWRDTATVIFDRYRDACQGERIFLTAHSHTSLKTLPTYYRQMAKHWATIYQNCAITNLTIEEILNQPIYHNPHIRRHNIMLKSTPLSKQHDIHLIADVAKVFVPGFLNCELTGLTQKHLTRIIMSIPQQWKEQINTQHQSYDHRRAKMHLRINGSPDISFGDLKPKNAAKVGRRIRDCLLTRALWGLKTDPSG